MIEKVRFFALVAIFSGLVASVEAFLPTPSTAHGRVGLGASGASSLGQAHTARLCAPRHDGRSARGTRVSATNIPAFETSKRSSPASALHAKDGSAGEGDSGGEVPTRSLDGVGGFGSNVLLFVSMLLVIKGLFLPEDIRHLSFCPPDDPIRGRDTLPWRMMEASGRECGSIDEVMYKYLTAPIAVPGTPEWGVMLNVKEDGMKEGW